MTWSSVDNTREFVATTNFPPIAALDTETYFNPIIEGTAITKWIFGNKNNCPFGASMYFPEVGAWVHKDMHLLRPYLASEEHAKVLHNAKYDIHMLKNIGLEVRGKIWDTMLMMHLINEEQFCKTPDGTTKKSKRLKDLAYHFLGEDGHKYEDALNDVKKKLAKEIGVAPNMIDYKALWDVAPQVMTDYAVSDTFFTYELFEILLPKLEEQGLMEAYDRDMAATLAIVEVERNGFKADMVRIIAMKDEMIARSTEIQQNMYKFCHKVFNINSDEELVSVFSELGLEWTWFTQKGNLSTDSKVMMHIANSNGHFNLDSDGDMIWEEYTHDNLIGLLAYSTLCYRKITKQLSTFVEGIIKYADVHGRVHCDFNVCPRDDGRGGTVTGRISSSDPNFQNFPKKDKTVRKTFIPERDFVLVEFDYAQQEYRMLAHYSQDENLIQAIKNGWDVHTATAATINHIPYEKVTSKQRSKAKATNFGLVYGLGLAEYAASMGHKIDAALYNMAGGLMREKRIKPWNATLEATLPLFAGDDKAIAAITYYFSEDAQQAIELAKIDKAHYFARFPKVEAFLADVIETCKVRGYIKTWTGRRRHFINPKQEAYKAPNALIQGGCGDITKEKLVKCQAMLEDGCYMSRMINTVHDSIVFEVHKSELFLIETIRKIMDDNDFRVPITCDIEWSAKSWGEMKKFNSIEEIKEEIGYAM